MSVTPKNGEGGEREKEREEKERRRGKEENMIRNENDRRLQRRTRAYESQFGKMRAELSARPLKPPIQIGMIAFVTYMDAIEDWF